MNDHELHEDTVIDLGEASTETRGQAILDLDVNGGQLRFMPGIVEG